MPKLSRVISHTVSSKPTRAQVQRKYKASASAATASTTTGWNAAMGDASIELYKGIRDLIESIDSVEHPFPFTYSFLEDEEITIASGQPAPAFTIGGYGFNVSMDLNQSDTYIPRIDFDVFPYCGFTMNGVVAYSGIRSFLASRENANAWRSQNNVCFVDGTDYNFKYTLHLYYNSEYFYIGWQADNQDNIEGMLFFSHLVDRENKDWYMVTACPGACWNDDAGVSFPYSAKPFSYSYNNSSFIYLFKDGVNVLPRSNMSCISNLSTPDSNTLKGYDLGSQYRSGGLNTSTPISVYSNAQEPYSTSGNFGTSMLLNPCAQNHPEVSSSLVITQSVYKDAGDYEDKTDVDVYVSNPIVFRGAFRFSNQILMASDNAVTDKEYTFNGKNYYCPGCSTAVRLAFPFMLEY